MSRDTNKYPGQPGCPTKLTPELQAKYCQYIREGNFKMIAAKLVKVRETTINLWLQRGRQEGQGIYYNFFIAVEEAEAQNEAEMVEKWRMHTADDWRACKDFLEKRYQQRWRHLESVQIEASVEVNKSHEISEGVLNSADARRLASDLLRSFSTGLSNASGSSDTSEQQDLEGSESSDPTK